jgi:hypothetical protein
LQVPGATVAWSNCAGSQAIVEWQASQLAVVAICPAGLPSARAPSWHPAQLPGWTPAWSKRAGSHAVAIWQESQSSVVGT